MPAGSSAPSPATSASMPRRLRPAPKFFLVGLAQEPLAKFGCGATGTFARFSSFVVFLSVVENRAKAAGSQGRAWFVAAGGGVFLLKQCVCVSG